MKKRPPRAALQPDGVIDAAIVRDAMTRALAKSRRLQIPTEAALTALAADQESLRQTCLDDQRRRAEASAEAKAAALREKLVAALALIAPERPGRAAADDLRDALLKPRPSLWPRDGTVDWQLFAGALVEDFRTAMRSTNKDKISISNASLAEFLSLMIPRITGEQPTAASVRTFLKKRAKYLLYGATKRAKR